MANNFGRVRLKEIIDAFNERTGREVTYKELAAFVFRDQRTRPRNGQTRQFDVDGRGVSLLASWNNGNELTALKPTHLLDIWTFFSLTDINELIER